IFGFQLFSTWNMYDLVGLTPLPGTRWSLHLDEMTVRGPALGTDFEFAGKDQFGIPNRYEGLFKAYGMHDAANDVLGGNRGQVQYTSPTTTVPVTHPDWRGRIFFREQLQELPAGFTVQTQLSWLSDHNFLEQFYQPEFDNELNQETFLYVKQQQYNW